VRRVFYQSGVFARVRVAAKSCRVLLRTLPPQNIYLSEKGQRVGLRTCDGRRDGAQPLPSSASLPPYQPDTPRPSARSDRTRRVPPPVLTGHAASLPLYQPDTPRPSPCTNRTRRVRCPQECPPGHLCESRLTRTTENPPSSPPSRTKWTRLVHPSVLIGHVYRGSSPTPRPHPHGSAFL
jgi:hypothetical protein